MNPRVFPSTVTGGLFRALFAASRGASAAGVGTSWPS